MEKLTLKEIVEAVKGVIIKKGEERQYASVSTDTRTISCDSIFIALKGSNFNGNDYAVEASLKGAAVCIIDDIRFNQENFETITTVIKVEDGKEALMNLAKYYRSKLDIKVIGITGSTGKTSTKDLVAAVLSSKYKVFKTKGNFNNEIGLPLMIFNLDNSYDAAVLEMGMSNFGEIHNLADISRPDIALITNIGVSHIEYLKSRENILKAKLEITDFFSSENTLIVNNDNDLLSTIISDKYRIIKVGVDTTENVDLHAVNVFLGESSIQFAVYADNETSPLFNVDVPGKHNVQNALLAIACGKKLNLSYEEMIDGIKSLEVTSMRLDIAKGEKFTIIDDSYNASPDSMKAALDVLSNVAGVRKIAVLGTMKELGDKSFELHHEVGKYAGLKGIDLLITIGEFNKAFEEGFNRTDKIKCFNNNEDAYEYLKNILTFGDVVLVKASRSMKFETIVKMLKMINC